jgi:hypothetical protein
LSDVFREVDEEVRQDQHVRLWRAYGRYAIAAVVVIVLAVAGTVGWREYKAQQRLVEGSRFEQAVAQAEAGDFQAAADSFAEISDGGPAGYAALARLRRAATLVAMGDDAGALSELEALSTSSDVPEELRNVAILRAALLKLGMGSATGADPALEALAESVGPWRALAREILALTRLSTGDHAEAVALLTELKEDATASPAIRQRSTEILESLQTDES